MTLATLSARRRPVVSPCSVEASQGKPLCVSCGVDEDGDGLHFAVSTLEGAQREPVCLGDQCS